MTEEEEEGIVFAYDINSDLTRSKFMIKCPLGQEISLKINKTGHAMLIWS